MGLGRPGRVARGLGNLNGGTRPAAGRPYRERVRPASVRKGGKAEKFFHWGHDGVDDDEKYLPSQDEFRFFTAHELPGF